MNRILLLICTVTVMTATFAQTDNKPQKGLKGLWNSAKNAAGQLTQKKSKKADKKAETCWEALRAFAENIPAINTTDLPIGSETGFTLTKTNTVGGLKCEHYEKDGMQLRVFYKNNGDYFVTNEDPDGMNREPENNAKSLGKWRISEKKYSWYGGFQYLYLKWKFKGIWNDRNKTDYNNLFGNTRDIIGMEVETGNSLIIQDSKGNQNYYIEFVNTQPTYNHFKNGNLSWVTSNKSCFTGLRLASDSLKVYYPNGMTLLGRCGFSTLCFDWEKMPETVMVGDWLCRWDKPEFTKGEMGPPIAQIYGKWAVPATPDNKVTNIVEEGGEYKVLYENGDWFKTSGCDIKEAKLHIGKDVLVVRPDGHGRVEYADGSIFSGEMKLTSNDGLELNLENLKDVAILRADKIEPVTGTMQDAQGNISEYVNGKKKEKFTNITIH